MKTLIIFGLALLGYTFIYVGVSKFTQGITFSELVPAPPQVT